MVLPRSVRPRRIAFGPARGAVAAVDFSRDAAFYFGRHEPPLHAHYRRLLRPGMAAFDIGMYRGWDALQIFRLTGGPVLSVDGNPDCLRQAAAFLAPAGPTRIELLESYVTDGRDGPGLDDLAARHFTPDFIKMDIEGAETLALRGAGRLLRESRPAWIIEMHGPEREAECRALLDAAGYRITTVDAPSGPLAERRSLAHNRWLVCEPG